MTLTLEQVRQTRFHLARRNGYEPVDVDNFVDKVEATLTQLSEENSTLKQQIDALSSSEPSSIFVPGDPVDSDKLKSDLQGSQSDLEGLRGELARKSEELGQRQQELEATRAELDGVKAQLESTQAETGKLRKAADTAKSAQPTPAADGPVGRVDNIVVTSSAEASPAVTRLLQMATEQAERLVGESAAEAQRVVAEARAEAENVINGANKKAHESLTDARTRADRIESEARVGADKLTNDAQNRADAVNAQVEARRAELFTALEQERDLLRGKVDHLRSFESAFRANLTKHLQGQIKALSEVKLEPGDTPEIMNEPAPESATPRLDALLNEGN